ncbi:MAG: hypothetical protein N2578_08075 [Bdellovibrionaceae bacterium]|nr:hypothetical protein [Pseudobdellovibrionaceae bacterium]
MSLDEIFKVPDEERDLDWEARFFTAFTEANVRVISPDPQIGPDGWPYLLVETGEGASEPVQKILHWLSERGIGLVVNPRRAYPDFVFTYGMIWNFRETGRFYGLASEAPQHSVSFEPGEKILAGAPSEVYLPSRPRSILREFFRDQGLLQVKILVISRDGKRFDLAFSSESLGSPPEKERQGILEAISWFLPPHYSLMIISERGLPPFHTL